MNWILGWLGLSAISLVVLQWLELPGGELAFLVLALAFPVALCALGGLRRGRLGRLGWLLAALLAVVEVSGLLMLRWRGGVESTSWFFGVPAATAAQWIGLGLLPLLLVGFGYAWSFDSQVLDSAALRQLRERFGPSGAGAFESGQPGSGQPEPGSPKSGAHSSRSSGTGR